MPQNPTPAAAGDTNPTTAHDALLQKGLSVYEIAVVLDMHRAEVLVDAARVDEATVARCPRVSACPSCLVRLETAQRIRALAEASAPSQREAGAL
ncbi:hypothetical protein ACIQH0_37440 [Streptomyces griseus]|uniref:hypothetical protein n=1 Tax=Streptomyces griseus TaxID=1911 RepID=UPI0038039CFA